jgi:hypothetical protein
MLKALNGDVRRCNSQAAAELLRIANGIHPQTKLEELILRYDPAFGSASSAPRDEFGRRQLAASKLQN